MKLSDIVDITLTNLLHQKIRSWLTILGIVIGVASIISLISISIGMQENVSKQTGALGANQITVTPGSDRAGRMMAAMGGGPPRGGSFSETGSDETAITFKEAEELASISGISALDAELSERSDVIYDSKNISLTVIGTDPDALPKVLTTGLEDGRYLSSSDRYSAVIGYRVAHEVFVDKDKEEELNLLNKQLEIGGIQFKVVGVIEESGGMQGSDDRIYIPLETAKDLFGQDENATSLVVVAEDGKVDAVASAIEAKLKGLHDLDADEDADFSVITSASMQSAVSSITDTLTLFLGGIASISLIVGGIGVLNTMYMSVLEQTKTIGVLKALGARDRDIISLFLFEAATLGFIGGAVGVGLSFFGSIVLSLFSLPSVISPELVGMGLVFSIVVGIVAGIVPARNAAQISPVECLRYE
jgi:putative ABC transport system permease protein